MSRYGFYDVIEVIELMTFSFSLYLCRLETILRRDSSMFFNFLSRSRSRFSFSFRISAFSSISLSWIYSCSIFLVVRNYKYFKGVLPRDLHWLTPHDSPSSKLMAPSSFLLVVLLCASLFLNILFCSSSRKTRVSSLRFYIRSYSISLW